MLFLSFSIGMKGKKEFQGVHFINFFIFIECFGAFWASEPGSIPACSVQRTEQSYFGSLFVSMIPSILLLAHYQLPSTSLAMCSLMIVLHQLLLTAAGLSQYHFQETWHFMLYFQASPILFV